MKRTFVFTESKLRDNVSPAVEVYETATSSGGVAGGDDGMAEVGVEAEDEEHELTPSESNIWVHILLI